MTKLSPIQSKIVELLRLWPGITITLALWVVAAAIFAAYLEHANYAATYAGLAGAVTAIFFLYLVALAMIFGAEFNAALSRLREGKLACAHAVDRWANRFESRLARPARKTDALEGGR